jgi:hypothetical protein
MSKIIPEVVAEVPSTETSPPIKPPPLEDRVPPRWLRVFQATIYSGINRSRLFRLISEGGLKTAAVKESAHSTRGIRLIDRYSLDRYLEKLCMPAEEKLVAEAQALAQKEQELAQQQAELAKKQRETERELGKIRKRRAGGPLPTSPKQKRGHR